jgi:hypothetical protein
MTSYAPVITSYAPCRNTISTSRKGADRAVIARHEAIRSADSLDCFTPFAMTTSILCYNAGGTGRKGEIRTVIARHEAIRTLRGT